MRAARKPPHILVRRGVNELKAELRRYTAARRHRGFRDNAILEVVPADSIDALWTALGAQPYVGVAASVEQSAFDALCPGATERILSRAANALAHQVDLLGSGAVELGAQIDWHKDYKAGYRWPAAFYRDIDYTNQERPSDVKLPWELSRLQWLIPAGQAYLLTGDERYAIGCREILADWIVANPYARSVNWACTMEVALRILSWTWLFYAFKDSESWAQTSFRSLFLHALYLHGEFTAQNLERSDINGNHYTADAAGLVFAGLFFGGSAAARRWLDTGWRILREELPRQVFPDGVDFEASTAYHRLVAELFFLPALYRLRCGLDVPEFYRTRLQKMAQFSAVYSRPDGSVPLWGDADDARALPLGCQDINDHRYLATMIGVAFKQSEPAAGGGESLGEVFWLYGPEKTESIAARAEQPHPSRSIAFPHGGVYIMRNDLDHVFIDCGPVGLGGRGGHGHNDCLSFELVLCGVKLVSDCGAYLYTASYDERNRFRSTAYHNTPRINGEEINRFIRPDYLWNLHYDAVPEVRRWHAGAKRDVFCGAHSGYRRFNPPVTPVRTLMLDHERHALLCRDRFEGSTKHSTEIPLHLAPGVRVASQTEDQLELNAGGQRFTLLWEGRESWKLSIGEARVSPSYGVIKPIVRLVWLCAAGPAAPLAIGIFPAGGELGIDLQTGEL
jgi:uncharacterized heparinase superfamily protein